MRTYTLQEVAALAKRPLTLVPCWLVTARDGTVSRFTRHDADIVVNKGALAGTYLWQNPIEATAFRGADDVSVQNMEVQLPLESALARAAVRAGEFDGVRYTIFLTDWQAPSNVGIVVMSGTVGNVQMVDDVVARFELRGLKQYLQQNIVEAVSLGCRAQLGDARCGVDVEALRVSGTVASVSSARRIFVGSGLGAPAAEYYTAGEVTWTSGDNDGITMEVKQHPSGQNLELLEPLPHDIQAGDAFTIIPGCLRRLAEDCRDKFDNVVNFRGEPYAPDLNDLSSETPS